MTRPKVVVKCSFYKYTFFFITRYKNKKKRPFLRGQMQTEVLFFIFLKLIKECQYSE